MKSSAQGPDRPGKYWGKGLFEVRLSRQADSTYNSLGDKDRRVVSQAFDLLKNDPFNRKHRKLMGAWAGRWRIVKGDWRIIYSEIETGVIFVDYLRFRDDSTYRKP